MPLMTQFQQAQRRDAGFVDQHQLASMLLTSPHIIPYVTFAYNNKFNSTPLLSVLQASGRKSVLEVDNNEIQWNLVTDYNTPVAIVGDAIPQVTPGINFTEFVVPLAEKYFATGDVVLFGGGFPNSIIARVIRDPYQQGVSWCYTFQIIGANSSEFVPPQFISIGKYVTWVGTSFEEGSEGGSIKTSTFMRFKNQMNIHRMSAGMTGGAATDKLILTMSNPNHKTKGHDFWIFRQQHELMKQFFETQEKMLWFSRYNRLADGTFPINGQTGRPIMTGSGIEEQLSGANVYTVNRLTEEVLKMMLLDLKSCSGGSEKMIYCGAGFFHEFNRAMRESLGTVPVAVHSDTTFITKMGGHELAFGSQFTKYNGMFGTSVTLVHHPLFDDANVFPELHPVTNFTLQSYNGYILDMGDSADPNVLMVTKKGPHGTRELISWFTAGGADPYGDFKGKDSGLSKILRSHDKDTFNINVLSEFGVIIKNPLCCARIIIQPPA